MLIFNVQKMESQLKITTHSLVSANPFGTADDGQNNKNREVPNKMGATDFMSGNRLNFRSFPPYYFHAIYNVLNSIDAIFSNCPFVVQK